MAEPDALVRSAAPPSAPAPLVPGRAALAAAALLVFGSGMLVGAGARAPVAAAASDPCALPAGIAFDALGPRDRTLVTRRALACADLAHGRIDGAAYRAAIAALDAAADRVPAPPPPPAAMVWAASVRDVSSQYSAGNWSAARALGAPDVYPAGGDQVNAWASLGADDRIEHLELGLERPTRLQAVEIFETFNPGAVSQVELIGQSGARTVVHRGAAAAPGTPSHRRRLDFACTAEPIVAVRVTIDSPRVAGWNEIDAVGGEPCASE